MGQRLTLIKIAAFRAWVLLSMLWIVGSGVVIAWSGVSMERFLTFPYLLFVAGPTVAAFVIWRLVAWIVRPMLPANDEALMPTQDIDFNWRFGLWQEFKIWGPLAFGLLVLLAIGAWIFSGYMYFVRDSEAAGMWFLALLLLGPTSLKLLIVGGKLFLRWLLPEIEGK